jgi:neuronal guanine nucleotide exchange factor
MEAFLLAPIQRLARYPLLVHAILSATDVSHDDRASTEKVHRQLQEMVKRCNERMRELEDHQTVVDINGTLDYCRLNDEDASIEAVGRVLVKRGAVDLCTVSNRKVTKSKLVSLLTRAVVRFCSRQLRCCLQVEIMLFSDLFLYAKPVKVKKTGTKRYIVYKMVHRSLIEVRDVADLSAKEQHFMEVVIYDPSEVIQLNLRAASATDKMRWLDAFHPPQLEEDLYAAWDCPQARALYDYEARQADELTLCVGDVVDVLSRGPEWCKGTLVHAKTTAGFAKTGWFPTGKRDGGFHWT